MLAKFREFQTKANIYYAYHTIQRYTDEPFTSYMPEALFNISRSFIKKNFIANYRTLKRNIEIYSRYLMHELMSEHPKGVSQFSVLYALAKQSKNLGAFKLARLVMDKIQKLVVPKRFRENVDLASLMIRSKPYYDNEDLLSICYRCSTTNPLHNPKGGNCCSNCAQPFVHSFVSFEILPLVEFKLEDGVSDAEALSLIESGGGGAKKATKRAEDEGESNVMTLDDSMGGDDAAAEDPFSNTRLFSFQQDGGGAGGDLFQPVIVGRSALSAMEPGDVVVFKWPPPLRHQFFRNLMPDMPVTKCESCNRVFHTDDYELQLLQKDHCPFCRTPPPHFVTDNQANVSGGGTDDVGGVGAFKANRKR